MKQNMSVFLGVGLIVVMGIVYGVTRGAKQDTQTVQSETANTTKEEAVLGTFSGSMKDLVAKNQSVKCTFNHSTDIDSSSGTVYVSGGKIRGDFDINAKQATGTFEAHMITDGEYSYVWSSLIAQGFKMPIAKASAQTASQPTSGVDYNQKLDYVCVPWTVDSSLFVSPANVSFITAPTSAY